jgi:hypothetical protein
MKVQITQKLFHFIFLKISLYTTARGFMVDTLTEFLNTHGSGILRPTGDDFYLSFNEITGMTTGLMTIFLNFLHKIRL